MLPDLLTEEVHERPLVQAGARRLERSLVHGLLVRELRDRLGQVDVLDVRARSSRWTPRRSVSRLAAVVRRFVSAPASARAVLTSAMLASIAARSVVRSAFVSAAVPPRRCVAMSRRTSSALPSLPLPRTLPVRAVELHGDAGADRADDRAGVAVVGVGAVGVVRGGVGLLAGEDVLAVVGRVAGRLRLADQLVDLVGDVVAVLLAHRAVAALDDELAGALQDVVDVRRARRRSPVAQPCDASTVVLYWPIAARSPRRRSALLDAVRVVRRALRCGCRSTTCS